MPKAKKRKTPIVQNHRGPTIDAQSCRQTIRQFHVLLKRRTQLEGKGPHSEEVSKELRQIEAQIQNLGGLERYQQSSALGQDEGRGGGSEKVFIAWMKELRADERPEGSQKLRLLEVGALKHDNFQPCHAWVDCTPMDLHARHPKILELDFLKMDLKENRRRWEAISLSLVLNFVPSPSDRGRMLSMAHGFLKDDGLLFLALPLPCVANSRYLTFEHLKSLMASIGFTQVRDRWRPNGKMAYWLYRKVASPTSLADTFSKKTVLRSGQRNNFAITVK